SPLPRNQDGSPSGRSERHPVQRGSRNTNGRSLAHPCGAEMDRRRIGQDLAAGDLLLRITEGCGVGRPHRGGSAFSPGDGMSNIEIQDVSPEDRRKHLDFIQSVVNRMSAASAATKGWLLPVVTASYGYAVIKGSPQVAMLGVVALLLFGLLDANYLNQERCYRRLYDAVAQGGHIPPFAMNPALADRCAER